MTTTPIRRVCFGWLGVMAALCSFAAAPAAAELHLRVSNDWSPEDCGIFKLHADRGAATCGYVSVPLRHGDEASPRIRLAVLVIPGASDAKSRPHPLFIAQGGPGGSTISGFGQGLIDNASKRPARDRDLVLWDQRGTYFSQPRLICRELEELSFGADDKAQDKAYERCGARLDAEAGDLSAFNSLENARDIDSVRAALGYDAFSFYGVSYGTELGQFLLRERPAALRSVVLDAVVPLGFSLVTDVAAVKQQLMVQYAKSCEESPACNAAYPSIRTRYLALIDKLNREPVPLDGSDPKADAKAPPQGKPPVLTGKDLEEALYQSVYMREAVSLMPYIVYRAEQGDYSFALNFVQLANAANDDMADGMYMSVVCTEFGDTPESALRFPDLMKRLAEAGETNARKLLNVCRKWNLRLLDKALLQRVRSDIPTLLLSGQFDPITPPANADRVAEGLTHAYRFTFASGTHGQAFTVPCANQLIAAFLVETSHAPDGTCAKEASPRFVTPDELLSLPARRAGIGASISDNLLTLAAPAVAVALALLVLFSAVPFYAVAEIVHIFTRTPLVLPEGWRGRVILAAPWLPVLSGFLLFAFLATAAIGVGNELARNQLLLMVGAVPAWVKMLTWGLLPYALALVLMTVAMWLLWRFRERTLFGRLYYTVLVVAGWAVLGSLLHGRVFGV